jgi:riboflavin biosynthesis pyrimidine reductase/predicted DsbA family dithiol-disulfide isomerase
MSLTVPIAHDFICPWCWVGMLQAIRLRSEFDVTLEWRGYELFPDELEWPVHAPGTPPPANRPPTPSRFDFILAADGMELPKSERPKGMRTHNAHEAVEFAKTLGKADEMVEALYQAYWREGANINDPDVLIKLAAPIVGSTELLAAAIQTRKYKENIVGFDDDAYRQGVYNVPTFFIGDARLAEQPYSVLKKAVETHPSQIYANPNFPAAPEGRPYVFIDMVATIDGKILSGSRGEGVSDLGSATDHSVMQRLEGAADGVLVGATTLRATSAKWNPQAKFRFVVSGSGDLPGDAAFFQGEAYVVTANSSSFELPAPAKAILSGESKVDMSEALKQIRGLGVEKLLVLGGSTLNGELLRHDMVDELFLTVAPKVKLGDDVPTYAGGEALPREEIKRFELIEHRAVGNELFLRYRRERNT